jgi:hypothetical protein
VFHSSRIFQIGLLGIFFLIYGLGTRLVAQASGSQDIPAEFPKQMGTKSGMEIKASPIVAVNFVQVDGTLHLFLGNFTGSVPGKILIPTAVSRTKINIPSGMGNSLAYLPFLGQTQILQGTGHADQFELPRIERGAIAWVLGN